MLTHAPKYLVTYFESVSAFLLYPAPGCPGRDLPLESYLPHRRLWGGRSTSRVRLPFTGTITMALKPPFPSLYRCPVLLGAEAFPRRPSLHGLSYPWVSGNHTVIAPFGLPLITRHVAHRAAILQRPLRFPWAIDPPTRGTIPRPSVSAS